MIPVVTAEEMRAAEARFREGGGDLQVLMDRAGRAVAEAAKGCTRVLVLAGPGNNGGDGIVAAHALAARGIDVGVYAYKRSEPSHLRTVHAESDADLQALRAELARCDAVIDALLGIGRRRPIEGLLRDVIACVNEAKGPLRIAVDIPTGIDPDTGQVRDAAFRADHTVTMIYPKRGLLTFPGADYAGSLQIETLDVDRGLVLDATCTLPAASDIAGLIPRRPRDSNKGKSGAVLVIGGSRDYTGAPALVSLAAYRAGVGLVRIAVPTAAQDVVATHALEPVFLTVPGDPDHFTPDAVDAVCGALEKADAFALGPGLGQHADTAAFVRAFLERAQAQGVPGVADADALNALAKTPEWWRHVPQALVITPHPGEMGRLSGLAIADVQADRFGVATEHARRWGTTLVLKGAYSLVADPRGTVSVNPIDSPVLATAGTGDVLTGIIAALLGQNLSPRDAAVAGVWLHGAAGRRLSEQLGDSGGVASDLLPLIPRVRRDLEHGTWEEEDA